MRAISRRIERGTRSNRIRPRLWALEQRLAPAAYTVTNTNDAGVGSLRQAVINANADAIADTINFSVLFGTPQTIVLASEIDITNPVTIDGPGSHVTVSGAKISRMFDVTLAPAATAITLRDLDLVNGKAATGGAVRIADENVTIDDCKLIGNVSTLSGGAVAVTSGGDLTVTNSTLSGNSAATFGGAIDMLGAGAKLVVRGCSVSGNTATDGGALYGTNYLLVEDTTLSGNSASADGGAVELAPLFAAGALTFRNCTLSGNTAKSDGGAIFWTAATGGTLAFKNSSVVGNAAAVTGGAIAVPAGVGVVSAISTVFLGNAAPNGPDIKTVAKADFDHSALTVIAGITVFNNIGGSSLVGDPNIKLTPLGDYGGPTPTHRPLPGSSLINKGANPDGLADDQRGRTRVVGVTDIGAVEINDGEIYTVTLTTDESDGDYAPDDISLREAVQMANGFVLAGQADMIAFDPVVFNTPKTIGLTLGELKVTDSVNVVGQNNVAISGVAATRVFNLDGPGFIAVNFLGIDITAGKATGDGGAVRISDETVDFTNCSFISNAASAEGGAVAAEGPAVISFTNCDFFANSSAVHGGALNLDGTANATLTDCTLTGNFVTGGSGGAAYVTTGSLTLTDCTLESNRATAAIGDGGAISAGAGGDVSLDRCHVAGNTAGHDGGGIAFSNNGKYMITNSTLSGNIVGHSGGGLSFVGVPEPGSLVRNATFSDNSASYMGGAIHLGNFAGDFAVQNSTIASNGPSNKGGGIGRSGGGGTITAVSSIISLNIAGGGMNIYTTGTVNLTKCAVTNSNFGGGVFGVNIANILAAVDLKLGPLDDHGGPTPTHTLLDGSPCINTGSNPLPVLDYDQRGSGFKRDTNGAPDMGAFETPRKFIVDTLVDESDGNFGPGDFSFREAVEQANLSVNTQDRITFAVAGTIFLLGPFGEISVTDSLLVDGPGAFTVAVNGSPGNRILDVNVPFGMVQYVYFGGLTFASGTAGAGNRGGALRIADEEAVIAGCVFALNKAGASGGAIALTGGSQPLTIRGCTFQQNSANGGGAMAIDGFGHDVLIDTCVIGDNTSTLDGGAIVIVDDSTLTIRDSTLSGNQAQGGGSDGGACYFVDGGDLLVEGSTISGNKADDDGGGIAFGGVATDGAIDIRNSTVSGNVAVNQGGGVFVQNLTGTLVVWNSTITANAAGGGGGMARAGTTGQISLESTIISGNTAPAASGPDIASTGLVELKASAVGSVTGFAPTDLGGNFFGMLPATMKLGPLAANGGRTETHALNAGSPLRDKGTNPANLAGDQRGTGFGFLRVIGAAADIGAFEDQTLLPPAKVASVTINDGAAQRSTVAKMVVSFDQVVNLPASPADAFQLKRQSDNAAVNLNAVVSATGATTVVTITFTGGAVDGASLADGRYTLTILASNVSNVWGALDGNGDGTAGDDYVLAGDPATAPRLFRLFGDSDGDNDVDTSDFGAFRAVFGGSSAMFDFDNDGDVDTSDFGQFRGRFGASV